MTRDASNLPPELLYAVASRSGRISLVVGAGCSLEAPTGLELSRVYSRQVHDALVADGELAEGECVDPDDLSLVATTVHAKTGKQEAVVKRLPRRDFLYAQANDGYLLAAALMCEGSISLVATLNYDLALTDAVRRLGGPEIEEISGPSTLQHLGSKAIVYLHRNVNESDYEKWILRREALESEWRGSWESVVAARIAASPVLVFAGLGSPAAVLTESVAKVKAAVPDALQAYLVDPTEQSAFADALGLQTDNHVRAFWGEFMSALARRLEQQIEGELRAACLQMCSQNGWADSTDLVETTCREFVAMGLLRMGFQRARWLTGSAIRYEPDSNQTRPLIADLILGFGLLCEGLDRSLQFAGDGVGCLVDADGNELRVVAVSGAGHRRWSQLDALLVGDTARNAPPVDIVLASGFNGLRPVETAPPTDIVDGEPSDDITQGSFPPQVLTVDDLRHDLMACVEAFL